MRLNIAWLHGNFSVFNIFNIMTPNANKIQLFKTTHQLIADFDLH